MVIRMSGFLYVRTPFCVEFRVRVWEFFVAKKFSSLSMGTKIKLTKSFQHTLYVIECESDYH